ncbi:MAG: portal protein [Candidatus Omnitrophota bacterium]|jgi:hypothetical protein
MPETTPQKHIRVYDEQKSARSALEAYWQELTYFTLPRKAYITRIKSLGDKLPVDIYDSTAIISNAYFAAGMQAYMSGPQTKWFTIGLRNRALMTRKHILDYLRDTEDVLYLMTNGSNFYQEDVESYLGLGSIGTDILYCERDIIEDVRFDCLNIENVVILADAQGRANTAYIEYEYSADQAIGKFGDKKVGEKVRECYAKNDYSTKFKYLFCVFPREFYDQSKKDARNMPYAALWIDRERKETVRESGYKEFPFMVSRFAKSKGSPYGYSPAMNILPDIRMLNQMELANILGAQTTVRPPLEIPDEAFLRPYNFNPGGKNIKNAGYPNEHITPIVTGANVPLGIDYVKYKQQKVAQAFYNDLFILMESIGDKTATEVNILNNQRMQLLGSAVGNIMREKLSPVIERVYSIAAANGKLPPLPPELINEEYVIEYISPLARAQKSLELANLSQAMQIIASFGTVNPEVFDKIDFDELVDYTAEITNITPKVIRDDAEVEDIRGNRAQQNAMAMQMEMLRQGTETTKVATEADRNIQEAAQPAGVR